METETYLQQLRTVGRVLVVVGLLDIAVMVYCIANRISYSSSFNIFAVVAGIFLLKGNLRAAVVVRWSAICLLVSSVGLVFVLPSLQPIDLTLTQARLDPGSAVTTTAVLVAVSALLWWVQRMLGQKEILAARAAAGRKHRDMRIPVLLGMVLVVGSAVWLGLALTGESAAAAKSLVAAKLGDGYKYHVSSLSIGSNNQRTYVTGTVTAWNDREILRVPVAWEE